VVDKSSSVAMGAPGEGTVDIRDPKVVGLVQVSSFPANESIAGRNGPGSKPLESPSKNCMSEPVS